MPIAPPTIVSPATGHKHHHRTVSGGHSHDERERIGTACDLVVFGQCHGLDI